MKTFEERLKEKFEKKFDGLHCGFCEMGGGKPCEGLDKIEIDDAWSFLQDALREQKLEIREKVEVMSKRRLDSPRSFGDGDIVDVAPGYNQAIDDILTLLEGDGK